MTQLHEEFQEVAEHPEQRLNRQLIAAVWKGRLAKVRELVRRGANPDTRRGPQARTLLMNACEQGDVAMVRVLISSGASAVGVKDDDMDTSLHISAGGDKPELISILATKGANIESRNRAHYTPLMVAASYGKAANVRKLIAHGADPLAATKSGLNALHLATLAGEAETVSLLLKHGADPEAKTFKNMTPLAIARQNNDPAVMRAYLAHFSFQHRNKLHAVRQKRGRALATA